MWAKGLELGAMYPQGNLYIIAAASGTGKTSLAKALADSLDSIKISISHTTRPIKPGERSDVNYFFVDNHTFEQMIEAKIFLEYAKVFGHYYGTSQLFVEEQLNTGKDVVLDIDWQGAQQVRKKMPQCISIFLLPPSQEALRKRLETRKRDTAEVIEQRLNMASGEISHYNDFDYIVINDGFEVALQDLQAIVRAQRLTKSKQIVKYEKLIKELLQNSGE